MFKLADSQANRHIVQVFDKNGGKLFATCSPFPTSAWKAPTRTSCSSANVRPVPRRPSKPGGIRRQLRRRIRVSESQALKIAKDVHQPVLSMDDEGSSDRAKMKDAKIGRVNENGEVAANDTNTANDTRTATDTTKDKYSTTTDTSKDKASKVGHEVKSTMAKAGNKVKSAVKGTSEATGTSGTPPTATTPCSRTPREITTQNVASAPAAHGEQPAARASAERPCSGGRGKCTSAPQTRREPRVGHRAMRFMTIVTLAVVAVTIAVCAQQPLPTFQSASSELVVLPVTVTDKHGQLVTDLSRDRFVVFDNGRRQDVGLFSSEDTPVTIGLVLDNSASMRPKLGEVVAAALAFAQASNPNDELFTTVFDDDVRDLWRDRSISTTDTPALQAALSALVPEGRTALYDGLIAGLARAADGKRARKVLVLISDGGDNASHATHADVLAKARAANVTIYTIGLFDRNDADANPGVLKALAEATGGERFLPRSAGPLISACAHIAREIRSGYTIGYVPPDRDGAFHRIRVQVDADQGRKLTVRTRPGYFAAGVVTRR